MTGRRIRGRAGNLNNSGKSMPGNCAGHELQRAFAYEGFLGFYFSKLYNPFHFNDVQRIFRTSLRYTRSGTCA